MKTNLTRSIVILLLLLSSATASAGEVGKAAEGAPAPVRKIYKKSEEHQYSGSRLKGELKKPELSYIYQRKGLRAERIVKVPENFDEEIISGAGQF